MFQFIKKEPQIRLESLPVDVFSFFTFLGESLNIPKEEAVVRYQSMSLDDKNKYILSWNKKVVIPSVEASDLSTETRKVIFSNLK